MTMVERTRDAWLIGVNKELSWWRTYFTNRGLNDPDGYRHRLDSAAPLQSHLVDLLPPRSHGTAYRILDCAAGPATTVGKVLDGHPIDLVAVDALADRYATMLDEIGVETPVPTVACDVERLDERFAPSSFDLVHMRFALDHCYDPLAALRQMDRATRDDGAVVIEHYRDEGEVEFEGLRQWDLRPEPGDLVVANPRSAFSVRAEFPGHRINVRFSPTWLTVVLRRA